MRGKTSDKAAENNTMNNPVIFIPGIEVMKSMKVRCLEHVESMGVKRRSYVTVAGQRECDVCLRKRSCKCEENIKWALKECGGSNESVIEFCIHKTAGIALLNMNLICTLEWAHVSAPSVILQILLSYCR
jgi:hypothetical protein